MKTVTGTTRVRARAGVTLIELLTVIGIIIFLAAAVAGASYALLKGSQRKATENLFEQLASGLDAYRVDHRMYVPSEPTNPNDISSRPLWYALEHDAHYVEISGKFKQKDTETIDYATGDTVAFYIYIDGWRKPIRYTCEQPWRQFRIESAGPDRKWGTADDVTHE